MDHTLPVVACLLVATALAAVPAVAEHAQAAIRHRYLIERTFPAGALDGLDAAAKAGVNANNAELGVTWIRSYATADKTRTFCVYEGPSETAVRQAAVRNGIPVDSVTEIPVDLEPGPLPEMAEPAHRYVVERTFPAGALDGLDAAAKAGVNVNNAAVGVKWVGSYANADKTRTFCIYEGPSEAAVREAALRNSIPVDAVTEVPVDLWP
ncbi:MAG TPA: DUF4242 domain-containing protein [Thermoanaerobaculia bacterium]|nr:DUF4242 domain-containing protein [Thermoanaerobaculia bacterium]